LSVDETGIQEIVFAILDGLMGGDLRTFAEVFKDVDADAGELWRWQSTFYCLSNSQGRGFSECIRVIGPLEEQFKA
jgi:hypothetical protein